MYFLQRVTGVIVFAFILFHYWTTRLVQLHDHESLDLFRQVQAAVGNPWIYAFYVLGILSATFHLANGIWSFSIVWGLTVSPAAQRRMAYVSVARLRRAVRDRRAVDLGVPAVAEHAWPIRKSASSSSAAASRA